MFLFVGLSLPHPSLFFLLEIWQVFSSQKLVFFSSQKYSFISLVMASLFLFETSEFECWTSWIHSLISWRFFICFTFWNIPLTFSYVLSIEVFLSHLSFLISRSSSLFSECSCVYSLLFLLRGQNVFSLRLLILLKASSASVLFLCPLSSSPLFGVTLRMWSWCCLEACDLWVRFPDCGFTLKWASRHDYLIGRHPSMSISTVSPFGQFLPRRLFQFPAWEMKVRQLESGC